MRRVLLLLAVLLIVTGCARDDSDGDRDQRGGFYGGVSGGFHP